MATCPTIRPSRRTGMAASAIAICCGVCSRPSCAAAWTKGWSAGENLAVDASLIKADANRQKGIEGDKWPAAASRRPRSRGVSGRARRRGLWRRDRGDTKVHLTGRSGGALDRCAWRASLLRLFDQLSDRHRQRDHRRCRGDDRDPPGRGSRRQAHDRTRDGTLRSLPGQAPGRQRLWLGRDAGLARVTSTASSRM